jgi:type VI secretion system secreted protein VgrG
VGGPGKLFVKMEMIEKDGAVSNGPTLPVLPDGNVYSQFFILTDEDTGEILPNHPYRIRRTDGNYEEGITDEQGRTHTAISYHPEDIKVVRAEKS